MLNLYYERAQSSQHPKRDEDDQDECSLGHDHTLAIIIIIIITTATSIRHDKQAQTRQHPARLPLLSQKSGLIQNLDFKWRNLPVCPWAQWPSVTQKSRFLLGKQ